MTQYIIYFELVAFLVSLLALPVLWRDTSLKIFPLLLLITCAVEAHQFWIKFDQAEYNILIYNIHLLVEGLLYLLILYLSSAQREYRRIMLVFALIFMLGWVLTTLFIYPSDRFNAAALSIEAVLLVMGILLRFYEMLKSPTNFNFLKNPFFYMLFALMLFQVGTLPFFTMGNWLYYEMGQYDAVAALYRVVSILNFLLYSTYTFCFIWMRITKLSYS